LLRQTYDRLFVEQEAIIPIYFEFKPTDRTAHAAALRFLKEFLTQTVAFRRRDSGIIDASPEICEIAELAVPADGYWIDRLIETCHSDSRLNDMRSVVRNCMSAPLRAVANGAECVVIVDALEIALHLDGGDELFDDIREVASKNAIPFILCGRRRPLHGRLLFESLHFEPLGFTEAGKLVENLAAKCNVSINDQTRDLIAVQTGGVVGHIVSLLRCATENGVDLDSFDRVEQIYTDEVFGGRIGKTFDARFGSISCFADCKNSVLLLLSETLAGDDSAVSLDYWRKQFRESHESFQSILTSLHDEEFINLTPSRVALSADLTVRDYIHARERTEIERQPRALAVGETLAANIRRAPKLMARFYRGNAALNLSEFLHTLDGQRVAAFLIDYRAFKTSFKGSDDDKIFKAAIESPDKIVLPKIVFTAHASAVYPRLDELCEPERACVAIGMSQSEDIALLAAEIDSKLEASAELASFWCDRLEMVAAECGFENYRLWLITPEGFDDEAIDILATRNAYGSSRKQIELLAKIIGSQIKTVDERRENEYEITIPMGDETEIIAARAVEEIARRHDIPKKIVNQIKTALVEACINAAEHSYSPDQKIHQKVRVDQDRITITITNRGVRLADIKQPEQTDDNARRGWGLKLMRELMDDVQIEQTDDGTQITLVKLFSK